MSVGLNNQYQLIKIADDAWRIEEDVVRFFLFVGPDKSIVVDTGLGTGDPFAVVRTLTDTPVIVVNTHADPDHISGNSYFENIFLHPSEFYYYKKAFPNHKATPLSNGDVLDIGTRRFEVVHIPGHTPGSIALLDRENRVLVCGDSVSGESVYIFGENRSLQALIFSLEKLDGMKDAISEVYPSHGCFPLAPEAISAQLDAAKCLSIGELIGIKPPPDIPALLYVHGNASFFM